MWLFIKLAWRNIFRNKRRTFIAGIAIGIGLASLIFVDALIIGMKKNMIQSATSSFLGEGQIHRKGFRDTYDVDLTINHLPLVVDSLRHQRIVTHFTERTITYAMITSPSDVQSISLVGVNPSTEKYLSQVDEAIIKGNYFSGENERDILIGTRLSEVLNAGLGERIVITVSQAETGDLAQEMFRVSGIFHFNVTEMDRGMAFIRLKKSQDMLNIGKNVHEIALKFDNPQIGRELNLPFWKEFSRYGNEAIGWTQILPQLEAAFELSNFSTFITGLILFGVVALGIINTLFMSIHERMFEFGVMRAIGTSPFSVGRLIVFEAGALAIISIVLGDILGWIVTFITAQVGINYTGIEFVGVTFRELLYPVMRAGQFIFYPLAVFGLTVLIGIYPAVYAARMKTAEALRKSM
jgi:ABC-type lipoprotein release transport system permease subunit